MTPHETRTAALAAAAILTGLALIAAGHHLWATPPKENTP